MIDLTTRDLPNIIDVLGESFSIYTDFRLWLKCLIEFEENKNPDNICVSYLFKNKVPHVLDAGFFNFLFPKNELPRNTGDISDVRLLDFKLDQDLIYSSFLQQYKIDLLKVKMHWLEFNALMSGLSGETRLIEVMGHRAYKGKDKDLIKLRDMWALPEIISKEEQEEIDRFNKLFE